MKERHYFQFLGLRKQKCSFKRQVITVIYRNKHHQIRRKFE